MKTNKKRVIAAATAAVAAAIAALSICKQALDNMAAAKTTTPPPAAASTLDGFTREEQAGTDRTVVYSPAGIVVATLTRGARSVLFNGPERTFREPDVTATVTATAWVRVAPQAWQPEAWNQPWFRNWLVKQLGNTQPDVLAAALEYVAGGAGDADFGLDRTGATPDGADFYDYLGMPWTFPDGKQVTPDPRWLRHIDCSGYLRLVYGYRMGVEMASNNTVTKTLMPRSSYAIAANAPAVVVADGADTSSVPADLTKLQPGDLVFFALRTADKVSHSGIYLGKDDKGAMRFVSSRGTSGGPTFGDRGAPSLIDAGTYFGDHLRRAIRL